MIFLEQRLERQNNFYFKVSLFFTIDFTEAINLEITCHKKVEKSHQNLYLAQYRNFKIIQNIQRRRNKSIGEDSLIERLLYFLSDGSYWKYETITFVTISKGQFEFKLGYIFDLFDCL